MLNSLIVYLFTGGYSASDIAIAVVITSLIECVLAAPIIAAVLPGILLEEKSKVYIVSHITTIK